MRPPKADINFVEHMVGIADIFREDMRLSPYHISLYYALFHVWNQSMFSTPISIARAEIMKSAHIGSANTYLKCLKELSSMGYIKYEPSYNPMRGSLVHLYRIDTTAEQVMHATCTDSIQLVNKSCTSLIQVLRHYINYINNNKLYKTKETSDESNSSPPAQPSKNNPIKKKKKFIPPKLEETKAFFQEQKSTNQNAEMFQNHFDSNGWLVGGKTKMKDWKAAARNWILRSSNFNNSKKSNLHVNQDKDYDIPL